MNHSAIAQIDYPLIDADQHYYEPDDCFTRHLDPKFQDRTITVVRGKSKFAQVHFKGERLKFFSAPPGEHAGQPGSLKAFFQKREGQGALISGETIPAHEFPESMDRDVRMGALKEQNVQAAIMLPSLAVGVENELRDEGPETVFANITSFNKWLQEDWGWNYQSAIYSSAMLSLADIDMAVAELERVIKEGARIVHLMPGPVMGRSPADPHFDPFWARCEEAGVPVAFHIGNGGLEEIYTVPWGEKARPQHHRMSAFQRVVSFGERPVVDTITALIMHNLFGRFRKLQVVSIENGSAWVAPLLKKMEGTVRLCGPGDFTFGKIHDRPAQIFKEHISVAPFPEDDLKELIANIGPERVLCGSDWPHPEGIANPIEFAEGLEGLNAAQIRQVMRGNTAKLMGLKD
ncbi:MAG: amidohydrolase family protein [Pseudomonadota bacterium]|jgi:predicted TIM-barrel fold metal-dependent hydrolase|nr:amidohydrolase [Alphaproteobacteria bacterium]